MARDAAFCFIYAANLDCLRELGAQLVFFSPLADTRIPVCDAIWLPGGYPELHAAQLAANTVLRDSLAVLIAAGKPVWAECGGMMVLFDTLVSLEGESQPMWGLLPGTVTMQKRLAALEKKRKPLEYGSKEDFQLTQALAHLKGQPVQTSKSAKIENKKEPTINNPDGNGEKK